MDLIRCENGHFYDSDKFKTCPHCLKLMTYEKVEAESSIGRSPLSPPQYSRNDGQNSNISPSGVKEDASASVSAMPSQSVDNGPTVSYYASLIGIEPVVGWLVCIKGEYYGDYFRLKSGRNFIGRNADMDVVLSLDPKISRNRHVVITYEPRGRTFYVQPGTVQELFYLNGKVVLDNIVLKSNDILTIGDTKLMFIPCCGEQFSWDDMKKEEYL